MMRNMISMLSFITTVLLLNGCNNNEATPYDIEEVNLEKPTLLWPSNGEVGINHNGIQLKFEVPEAYQGDGYEFRGYVATEEDTIDWVPTPLGMDDNYAYWPVTLEHNKTYYWKVKMYDPSNWEVYSETWSFSTGNSSLLNPDLEYGDFTDSRDGNVYKTIEIDGQVWMAENLAYLPEVTMVEEFSKVNPSYAVWLYYGTDIQDAKAFIPLSVYKYGDWDGDGEQDALDRVIYETYGVIYNWPAANNACPAGWKLPSKSDWDELSGDPESLSSMKGWPNMSGEPGNNSRGFSAIPGTRVYANSFENNSTYEASWWSASMEGNIYNNPIYAYYTKWALHGNVRTDATSYFSYGHNVRCIKE